MIFLTAFVTGLLGSFHCAGMCGPIALALPLSGTTRFEHTLSRLLYNIGRITTYAVIGALFGWFGFGLKLAGMQQYLSIAAGVFIILMVVFGSRKLESVFQRPFKWIVGSHLGSLFQKKTYTSVFLIGSINGLLPCGFVYIGIAGSVVTQNAAEGALYMALFGLGTTPMLFGISTIGSMLSATWRITINKLVPVLAVGIGILFILRGLGLGIPYVSPNISEDKEQVKECCTPETNKK